MKLNILKVILWPKNPDNTRREIEFKPGMINIITGQSGTGKSSLTSIIDYCLGGKKCTIPVGIIRELTAWYGVLLQLENTELLLARRDPEAQQATDDMYWIQGNDFEIPAIISGKNVNRGSVKQFFNHSSNLPHALIDDSPWGKNAYPSFRDMAAFNFQPQHIVANPYTLFFKADTTEHREKLKIIFPLVLGAVTSKMIILQRELKDLEKEHNALFTELELHRKASEIWLSNVETYYIQAQGYGLIIDFVENRSSWTVLRYMEELKKISQALQNSDLPAISPGTSEHFAKELQSIIDKEDNLSQIVGELSRRFSKISQLNKTVDSYGNSLTQQEDRLKSVGWLKSKLCDSHICPVCATQHANVIENVQALFTVTEEFEAITKSVQQAPSKLEIELLNLKKELRKKEQELSDVREQRKKLDTISNEQAKQRQKIRQIYIFAGKTEQALENIQLANDSEQEEKLATLRNRISELRKALNPNAMRQRLDNAIDNASKIIEKYAKILDLEHADENVKLNIKDLTIEFKRASGRTDYLWEVGSGQNWVGYHIATLLALHEYISKIYNNPVPSFLLIDQPSQVYFPESSWESIDVTPDSEKNKNLPADIMGVQRIFTVISTFMETVHNNFQVIITEHAGKITWENAKNVHLVGNWRDDFDEFLIPNNWLN